LAFIILFPLDGPIMALVRRFPPGGDIAQELKAWQQFGALGSLLFVALLVRLLDPARTRRLLDLAAAAAAAWFLCQLLKIVIGRPRPQFDDPGIILTPFGAYPLGPDIGVRHAWELWADISTRLWSMPSSHTSAAAALAVFLTALYPRLRGLSIVMVCLVGTARVIFNDHWSSDVAVGAAVGVIAARAAVHGRWGQRLALEAIRASGGSSQPLRADGPFPREPTDLPRPEATQDGGGLPAPAAPPAPTPRPPPPNAPNPLHSAP
jgi:undecaprenyl-diphosphatase